MRNYSQKMAECYHKVAIAVLTLQKLFELRMNEYYLGWSSCRETEQKHVELAYISYVHPLLRTANSSSAESPFWKYF